MPRDYCHCRALLWHGGMVASVQVATGAAAPHGEAVARLSQPVDVSDRVSVR